MRIPTKFDKCIICLDRTVGSYEHIIPDYIGGHLQAKILCKNCNNYFGSTLIAKIADDPLFFYAFEFLKDEIPSLYKRFNKRRTYLGKSSNGSKIELRKKGNELVIIPRKKSGVLEIDINEANPFIEKRFQRSGIKDVDVSFFIRELHDLKEGEKVQLPTGEILSKIAITEVEKKIPLELINERFWLLIAFEFFSLIAGKKIYHHNFDIIRNYLLGETEILPIKIKGYQGKKYEAIHGIMVEPFDKYLEIHIRLFRWIAVVATFDKVHYSFKGLVYHEDLKTHECKIAFHENRQLVSDWTIL